MIELTNEVNFWAVEVPGANVGGSGAGEKFDGNDGVVDLVWPSVGVGGLKVKAAELVVEDPKPLNPANLGLLEDYSK